MDTNISLDKFPEPDLTSDKATVFMDISSNINYIDELINDSFFDDYFNKKLKSNNLKITDVKTQ
jgi:hypothetical protein|tara:strand:- start:992 stop:1183 length:192 start_codon:yes stop_codon:yes gene_type:complete